MAPPCIRAAEKFTALRRDAAMSLLVCGAGAALLAVVMMRSIPLGWHFLLAWAVVYAAIAGVVLTHLEDLHPCARFGGCNRVTTVRAAITALFGGLASVAPAMGPASAWWWWFALLATAALILDGVDGWLSRRTGMASAFGARYDMEIDALLITLLAVIAWRLDKADAWILAIGAVRYVFVAATGVWHWLAAPLPPSGWRKLVCVIQGAALCALLTPPFNGAGSRLLAATALTLLLMSFAVDVRWLFRHARPGAVPLIG